ncbi:hypothetical protein [Flavihumibacter sp. ZG627]|uniref:hypothetical protein n=1 Tax=Flavihumibacter sp. ZG627 TaxID=1463156 RepID=UPI000693F5B2|nr:hypothetical protein [Flavihumibacter sp. ZG627]
MKVDINNIYHLYNRGNQKQVLFYNDYNYTFFLGKIEKHLLPCVDILSWTLMPNHYHLMIHTNERSVELIENRILPISRLSESFRLIQSSYTKALNAERNLWGNLFHQKFQSKLVHLDTSIQATNTFHYVHSNATRAGLVDRMEDWNYSSYNEYLFPERKGLCNKELAMHLLGLDREAILRGM